jgi:hypothetical protein
VWKQNNCGKSCRTGKRQKKKPDFRPAPLRTKRLKFFATALAANFIAGAAPQTYALHHTRNTAFLHLNDVMRITQAAKAASHHFWGQADPLADKRGVTLLDFTWCRDSLCP